MSMDHFHHHVNSWYLASPSSFGVVGRESWGGGALQLFSLDWWFCVVSSSSNVFYLQQPPSTSWYFWHYFIKGTTLLTLSIVNTTGRRFWRSSSAQRRVSDRGGCTCGRVTDDGISQYSSSLDSRSDSASAGRTSLARFRAENTRRSYFLYSLLSDRLRKCVPLFVANNRRRASHDSLCCVQSCWCRIGSRISYMLIYMSALSVSVMAARNCCY